LTVDTDGQHWRVVVGVDPSTSSAGWCVLGAGDDGAWVYIDSGQCVGLDLPAAVRSALPLLSDVVSLGVEGIYHGVPSGGKVKPPTYWKMGLSTGLIIGSLRSRNPFIGSTLWMPQPNEWRDMLKIKRGSRDAVAHRVLRFARDATGVEMEGPRGGKQVDRAMAVGVAYATVIQAGSVGSRGG